MTKEEFKERTDGFALRVIRLVNDLPDSIRGNLLGNQLFLSGTSVAANYRKALKGRTKFDFFSKLVEVEEMIDESIFWMEMMVEGAIIERGQIIGALNEAKYISAIITYTKNISKTNNDNLISNVIMK